MKTYGLKVIAGRPFSKSFGSDDRAVIFNIKGIQQLGFEKPEEALNKRINIWGGGTYTIIGVTDNFHQQSLHDPFEPLILRCIPDVNGYLSLKVNGANASSAINSVKAEWKKFFPGNTFDYFFLDEHFNDQYKADRRFRKVFGLFTCLAVLVACMGLFGLASFTTLQRTKEIGIRKVLGASVVNILKLLYGEFASLLLISFLIATPLAWLAATKWLEGYAFRMTIKWTFLIFPFITITAIALITVSFQSIKAAVANPVKSLRSE